MAFFNNPFETSDLLTDLFYFYVLLAMLFLIAALKVRVCLSYSLRHASLPARKKSDSDNWAEILPDDLRRSIQFLVFILRLFTRLRSLDAIGFLSDAFSFCNFHTRGQESVWETFHKSNNFFSSLIIAVRCTLHCGLQSVTRETESITKARISASSALIDCFSVLHFSAHPVINRGLVHCCEDNPSRRLFNFLLTSTRVLINRLQLVIPVWDV